MSAPTVVNIVHRQPNIDISSHPRPPLHVSSGSSGIKCMYTNTDQLTNKLEEVILFVKDHDVDVIAINETLPKNSSNVNPAL